MFFLSSINVRFLYYLSRVKALKRKKIVGYDSVTFECLTDPPQIWESEQARYKSIQLFNSNNAGEKIMVKAIQQRDGPSRTSRRINKSNTIVSNFEPSANWDDDDFV